MADFTIDEEGVLRGVTLAEGETAVELPSTVRAIGAKAFTSKHQCTKVTLNDECQEIREQAFYNNQTITELVIGTDLATIQHNAFAVNNPLKKIKIHGLNYNYTNICKGLEVVPFLLDYKTRNTVVLGVNADEIVIPTGVTHIGAYAFANCKGIKKLTFASTKQWQLIDGEDILIEVYYIKEIGDWAFSECIGLGTYAVGKNAADGMLTIPSTVETLGIGAFWGCSNVRTVDIKGGKDSGSLHYLPAYSFGGMERLTTLHIPLSVLGWDYQQYDPENYIFTYPDEYGINRTIGESTFQGSTNIEYVALENTPTDLIPDNIETDEEEWWDEKISPLITTLASFPVDASGKAVQVTLVYTINGIEYKNQYTSKCIQRPFPGIGIRFELLTLPTLKYDGLTFEGWYTDQDFKNPCNRPTDVNPNWTYAPTNNTTLYAKLSSASNAFNYEVKTVTSDKGITSKYVILVSVKDWEAAINDNDKSLIIPETLTINDEVLHVKSIGDYCCAGGKGFEKAEIPRYITGIGYSAFEGCVDLTEITFASGTDENGKEWKSSLTTIKGYAFTNTGITEIALPESVTSLYQGAFYNCPELETIILNENLKSIGSEKGTRYGTFDKCPNLQNVYVKGIKEWLDIDIGYSTCNPLYTGAMLKVEYKEEGSSVIEYRNVTELNKDNLKGITEIPSFAFTGYMGLQKVDLTDTDVVTIGEEAFNNCQRMTELELRNGKITTLGRAAFSFCTGIESIVIPNTITTLYPEVHAFDGCSGVKYLAFEEGIDTVRNVFRGWDGLQEVAFSNSIASVEEETFIQNTGIKKIVIGQNLLGGRRYPSESVPTYQSLFVGSIDSIECIEFAEGIEVLECRYPDPSLFEGAFVPGTFPSLKEVIIPSSAKVVRQRVLAAAYHQIFIDTPKLGDNQELTVYKNWLFKVYEGDETVNWPLPTNLNIRGLTDSLYLMYFGTVFIPNTIQSILHNSIMICGMDEESPGIIKVSDIRQWASIYFESDSIEAPYGYDLYIAPDAESEGTKVTILDIDVSISSHTFSKCNSIEKIILRDGCQEVGAFAFSACKNVTAAYFSASVEYIGSCIFYDSLALTEITVQDLSKFIQAGTNQDEIDFHNIVDASFYDLYQADTPDSERHLVTKVELPTLYTCSLYNCTSITEIVYTEEMTTLTQQVPTFFPNVSILEFKGVIDDIRFYAVLSISQDKYRVIKFHHRPNLSENQQRIMMSWYASLNKECKFYFVGEESGFEEEEELYDNGKEGEESKKFIITKWGGE